MQPLGLFLFASCLPSVWLMDLKALDEFVNLPDPHYEYTFLRKKVFSFIFPYNFLTLNMTSQKWLDETEVDKPVWSHEVTIVKPDQRKIGNSCLLIITTEQNGTSGLFSPLTSRNGLIHLVFVTRSIVAVLNPVPAQPLTFYKHPLGRENMTEPDTVAYTWWRFINDFSAPPHWLAQFPMVKATVRAMDTITDYMMKTYGKNITNFTLTGISMNGWTAWLTAAVDRRVAAIIPIAMDVLNFTENFLHHFRSYCGWSYMLKPFYEMNITQHLDHPRFILLASHVDPLAYNERYTNIFKFIIDISGDEMFQPDNSHYYFPQLEGKKYLHIIPNADYRFQSQNTLLYSVTAFHGYITRDRPLPKISWQRTTTNTTGIIDFNVGPQPLHVYCYHADTVDGTRRDFRMKIAAGNSSKDSRVEWIRSNTDKVKMGAYKKELEIPANGWRAFFIQAIFAKESNGGQLTLTSELHVIPDTFPCPDCSGDGCHGTLV